MKWLFFKFFKRWKAVGANGLRQSIAQRVSISVKNQKNQKKQKKNDGRELQNEMYRKRKFFCRCVRFRIRKSCRCHNIFPWDSFTQLYIYTSKHLQYYIIWLFYFHLDDKRRTFSQPPFTLSRPNAEKEREKWRDERREKQSDMGCCTPNIGNTHTQQREKEKKKKVTH